MWIKRNPTKVVDQVLVQAEDGSLAVYFVKTDTFAVYYDETNYPSYSVSREGVTSGSW